MREKPIIAKLERLLQEPDKDVNINPDGTIAVKEKEFPEKELGIGIQFTCTIGQGRQIAMTAGVPLDWEESKLNSLLDKLSKVMDRQGAKSDLAEYKARLEAGTKQLTTNEQQLANFELNAKTDWEQAKRNGPWRASESQRKQIDIYKQNSAHLTQELVKLEKTIKDAEEKCR
jgi:hypothetical protein